MSPRVHIRPPGEAHPAVPPGRRPARVTVVSAPAAPPRRRVPANRVRELREAAGLSRRDLGAVAGVSIDTIQRIELRTGAMPRPGTVRRLAQALLVHPLALWTDERSRQRLARLHARDDEGAREAMIESLAGRPIDEVRAGLPPALRDAPAAVVEAILYGSVDGVV